MTKTLTTTDMLEKMALRVDKISEFCRAFNDTAHSTTIEETDRDTLNRLGVLHEILEDEIELLHVELVNTLDLEMKSEKERESRL